MTERQQKILELKEQIYRDVEEEDIYYYNIPSQGYKNIEDYLLQLDNPIDRLTLAQCCLSFENVKKIISKIQLDEYQTKKYELLKGKNIEVDDTINFDILSPKYEFLDDILDSITTDIDIQQQIISLNKEQLKLFELLYQRLKEVSNYNISYIKKLLTYGMGYTPFTTFSNDYKERYSSLLKELEMLLKNEYPFSNDMLDKLLFLFTNPNDFDINNLWDLKDFGTLESLSKFDDLINNEKSKSTIDIKKIKDLFLMKSYGISFDEAKLIIKKYDLSKLEINEDNADLFEMYNAINCIVFEDDVNVLLQVYDEFTKKKTPKFNFMRITTFENDLRKEFAKFLNRCIYKVNNNSFTENNGIKIYDAGVDFKMIVTAIGAYQGGFTNKENYFQYWNSPYIQSHGNCCSLIANNNLSMAESKNIILGFSNMDPSMLLLSGKFDIDSTPSSKEFDMTFGRGSTFYTSPEELINNTRTDYNELVYERRDLNANANFYKKNPDYIVFIDEYIDIDYYIENCNNPNDLEYLKEQKRVLDMKWKETLKAAKDFGVPIVRINREKCAINESQKIQTMLENFKLTNDSNLINEIIMQFENNRVGNTKFNNLIRNKYFGEKKMESILSTIKEYIMSLEDVDLKQKLINSYGTAIEIEMKKLTGVMGKRTKGQTSAINYEDELANIELLKQQISMPNSATNLPDDRLIQRDNLDKKTEIEVANEVKEYQQPLKHNPRIELQDGEIYLIKENFANVETEEFGGKKR